MEELNESSKMSGLKVNFKKTRIMFNNYINSRSIKADNNELEIVDNYIYLGRTITMNNDIMEEILNRTNFGWRKFGQLNIVFKSNIPFCGKRFNECVLPVLTCLWI